MAKFGASHRKSLFVTDNFMNTIWPMIWKVFKSYVHTNYHMWRDTIQNFWAIVDYPWVNIEPLISFSVQYKENIKINGWIYFMKSLITYIRHLKKNQASFFEILDIIITLLSIIWFTNCRKWPDKLHNYVYNIDGRKFSSNFAHYLITH